jgi:hypothetical protein
MHSLLKGTVLGSFGHVTRQASGWRESEAVEFRVLPLSEKAIENYALVNAL